MKWRQLKANKTCWRLGDFETSCYIELHILDDFYKINASGLLHNIEFVFAAPNLEEAKEIAVRRMKQELRHSLKAMLDFMEFA